MNGFDHLEIVMFQQIAKIFCIALFATAGSLNAQSLAAFSNAEVNVSDSDSIQQTEILTAKKSGGRSGGGSFKKRSSGSSQSKPSGSFRKKSSGSTRTSTPSRTLRRPSSSPTYRHRHDDGYRYRNTSRNARSRGGFSILWLMLIIFLIGFILVYLSQQSKTANKQSGNQIANERDNDRVTVSLLQVALSSAASGIQENLSQLSTNKDTETKSGLVTLMQESALILLRHETAWTHVLSSSNSLDIEQAESAFNRLSLVERSKFSSETLSNIDGVLKTGTAKDNAGDDFADYVVVTLILGTADDNPLFDKIDTVEALKAALLEIASMRDDYLFKFELLWTPQQVEQYLTDEELLLEYTNIIPLV